MKKRILALLLTAALLLGCVPAAAATAGGMVDGTVPAVSTGPVQLPVGAETGTVLQNQEAAEPAEADPADAVKLVEEEIGRFSQSEAANLPRDTDIVNFVVVMQGESLLEAGFSKDEIAAQTASVSSHLQQQEASLNQLKKTLTQRFAADESFRLGYTYTVATNGVAVTTRYGNKAMLEAMPGVAQVYLAPEFQLPEDFAMDTGDVFQPTTSNSRTMIGADVLNESGYTGKGMRIAILDTGIKEDHPNFAALPEDKLTEDSLTAGEVNDIWDTLNAAACNMRNQSYSSTKIPFKFNYDNLSFNVANTYARSDHGTHVAGIAAANKLESSTVVGMAPDAQILAMQVFNPGGGASWTIILAALEDAIRLNADVANLSLGMAAGFTASNDKPMMDVLKRIADTDMELIIAAGNDTNNAYMNLTGLNMSLAGNPDIGLAGSPSTYHEALSVASVDNDGMEQLYFTVNGRQIGYADSAMLSSQKFLRRFAEEKTQQFVVVPGYGMAADYEDIDVQGKIAVVSRGGGSEATFPVKQANAQNAGAIACIVYNNVPGIINMQINQGEDFIPCVSISREDGMYLVEQGSGTLTVCDGDLIKVKMDRMISDFSSWGCAPDLTLKPEIAGVGGSIYSCVDPAISGSYYGTMSGTSMATPQVVGAMAVLMQYLREHYDYEEAELRQVAADLMMSTAEPLAYDDLVYSPRAQGAGLVDLISATTSQAYLSSKDAKEGRPKGEFGDDDDRTGVYEFHFEINNMSADQDRTYSFDASVLTETLYAGNYIQNAPYALEAGVEIFREGSRAEGMKYDFNDDGEITTADARMLLLDSRSGGKLIPSENPHYPYVDVDGDGKRGTQADMELLLSYCAEMDVAVDVQDTFETEQGEKVEQVTVPAGESVSLLARITLSEQDKTYLNDSFPNGMYVEGYLYVNSEEEDGVDLQMPFLGFYGDWSDAPVFDAETEAEASLYPRVIFTDKAQIGTNPYLRGGKSGDLYNAFSYTNPLAEIDFGMLRNAKRMTFTVTDCETGEQYWAIEGSYLAKTFYQASYGMVVPFFVVAQEGEVWNGLDAAGQQLPDGTRVNYTVQAWLDDGDDQMDDSFSFQVTLDSKKPQVINQFTLQEDLKIDEEKGQVLLPLTLQDNQYIAALMFVDTEGTIMGKFAVDNEPGKPYTAEYDITGFGTDFTIVVADYACNEYDLDVSLNLGSMSDKVAARKELDQGRLYGCETFSRGNVEPGWFSANKADCSDQRNETFDSTGIFYSAEYVNGYLVALSQATNNLVLVTPASTYWRTMPLTSGNSQPGNAGAYVLYDMALDYSSKGKGEYDNHDNNLYAVGWKYAGDNDNNGKDDGHNALFKIGFYQNGYIDVEEIAAISGLADGVEILTLGCTTDGQLYGIDTEAKLHSLERDGSTTYIGTTDFVNMPNYSGCNVIQSMGYDHNTGTMYWYAHSQTPNGQYYLNVCMTYAVDLKTGKCTEVGSFGPGGQTCLFVPTDRKSDLFTIGVDPQSFEISPYEVTMPEGMVSRMDVSWRPWNANPASLTWATSDPSVVTVNEAGFVTAVAAGQAEISATGMVWDPWGGEYVDGNYTGAWTERTVSAQVQVVPSEKALYGYLFYDFDNQDRNNNWITYSDQSPANCVSIGQQTIESAGMEGPEEIYPIWAGGTYYNGYVYTIVCEGYAWTTEDGSFSQGSGLFRSKVTKGETPSQTRLGEPELIGATSNIMLGHLAFDYNTGRMYAVDLTNGGLAIVDIDTGAVDLLGTFSGDIGGPAIATAMCITRDGTIVIADAYGVLYTVDCDTLQTTRVGSRNGDTQYMGGMTYDYNTDSIYWNPCNNTGDSPLYLVRLNPNRWDPSRIEATIVKLGSVSSKYGVEQTSMFTIPDQEPETKRISVAGIEITNGEKVLGLVGGSLQLQTVTTPARPTVRTRTWSSSDPSVVSVDAFGVMHYEGIGKATVTVSITNKDEATEGGPFTDTIEVEVLEAAGDFIAFVNSDNGGAGYYDYWLTVHDYDVQHTTLADRAIDIYSINASEYYDGYVYGYDRNGDFYRIDNNNRIDYVKLGNCGLDIAGDTDKVSNMAFDYTTGTMYALTLPQNNQDTSYLATVDLDTGAVTKIAHLDQRVYALAVDKNGTLYAAGSVDMWAKEAGLYTVDAKTGVCTKVMTMPDVKVYTAGNFYGRYCPQMTYDYTTNRLYLNTSSHCESWEDVTGFCMVQLGDTPTFTNLGKLALDRDYYPVKVGNMFLGLLCAVPEANEIPAGEVNGVIMRTRVSRLEQGTTLQLDAKIRPSTAPNQNLVWTSSDPSVATVDENGLVTGLKAGTTVITAASQANSSYLCTCEVTVVNLEGPQPLAYTVSAQNDSLVSFNPVLPQSTAETVCALSGGSNIAGVAIGDDCLYYVDKSTYQPTLYRFDMATKQSTNLGMLQNTTPDISDIAYDPASGYLYMATGFYVYQYDTTHLTTESLNWPVAYRMVPNYDTLNALACVGTDVYVMGRGYNGTILYKIGVTEIVDGRYQSCFEKTSYEEVARIANLNVAAGRSEMDYDSTAGLLYITDSMDHLFSLTLQGENLTEIGILSTGWDLNGLAIIPAKQKES